MPRSARTWRVSYGWQVTLAKLGSWLLPMIISVVLLLLVRWVYPPRPSA